MHAKPLKNDWVDLNVPFGNNQQAFECRLVIHPHLSARGSLRYLRTNLDAAQFSGQQISGGYRLRWRIEPLFKAWQSHSNLHTFDTTNAKSQQGLILASLCAVTLKRCCADATERPARVVMSTRTVAKCVHHVLVDVLRELMHDHERLPHSVNRAIRYLASIATRTRPNRSQNKRLTKRRISPYLRRS